MAEMPVFDAKEDDFGYRSSTGLTRLFRPAGINFPVTRQVTKSLVLSGHLGNVV